MCTQLESALIFDAVQLFTTTVYNLSKEFEINEVPTPCNSSLSWKHGFTLINHMKMAVSTHLHIYVYFYLTSILHTNGCPSRAKIKKGRSIFVTEYLLSTLSLSSSHLIGTKPIIRLIAKFTRLLALLCASTR